MRWPSCFEARRTAGAATRGAWRSSELPFTRTPLCLSSRWRRSATASTSFFRSIAAAPLATWSWRHGPETGWHCSAACARARSQTMCAPTCAHCATASWWEDDPHTSTHDRRRPEAAGRSCSCRSGLRRPHVRTSAAGTGLPRPVPLERLRREVRLSTPHTVRRRRAQPPHPRHT